MVLSVRGLAMTAGVASFSITLFGCSGGELFLPCGDAGTAVEWSACEDGGSSAGCDNLCVMTVASATYTSLELDQVSATLHNTTAKQALQLRIDPHAKDYVIAKIQNDGTLCMGWDVSKVTSDPKADCIKKQGMKLELWSEEPKLSKVELDNEAALEADDLREVSKLSLDNHATATIGSLTGASKFKVEVENDGTLVIKKGEYQQLSVEASNNANVDLGTLSTTVFKLDAENSAVVKATASQLITSLHADLENSVSVNLQGMDVSMASIDAENLATIEGLKVHKSLKVDLENLASVKVSADAGCTVTGSCEGGSTLSVSGATANGVKCGWTSSDFVQVV